MVEKNPTLGSIETSDYTVSRNMQQNSYELIKKRKEKENFGKKLSHLFLIYLNQFVSIYATVN